MRHFDYERIAQDAKIPPDKLEELRQQIRQEFPHDEMMYELHLLRAGMAIKRGVLGVEEALRVAEHSNP